MQRISIALGMMLLLAACKQTSETYSAKEASSEGKNFAVTIVSYSYTEFVKVYVLPKRDVGSNSVRICFGSGEDCEPMRRVSMAVEDLNGKKIYSFVTPINPRGKRIQINSVTADNASQMQRAIEIRETQSSQNPGPTIPGNTPTNLGSGNAACYKGSPLECQAEEIVAQLTNQFRQQNRLNATSFSAKISFVARDHSLNRMNSRIPPHAGFKEGARDAKYAAEFGERYMMNVENVAMFDGTTNVNSAQAIAEQFFVQWRDSLKGHKENMLKPENRTIGVGIKCRGNTCYGTQIFGFK